MSDHRADTAPILFLLMAVYLADLAANIDKRRAAAIKECQQLTGTT